MKIQVYLKCEVYFRSLDFHVASLVSENLYVLKKYLKQRLKEPQSYCAKNPGVVVSLYKEIEGAVFHFIYHSCEDWRLYLPGNRQITIKEHHTGIHKRQTNST